MPVLVNAFVQSLEKRACRLQPKFFGELNNRRPTKWFTQAMVSQLVPKAASAKFASPYLRAEAMALLQKLIGANPTPTAALVASLTGALQSNFKPISGRCHCLELYF